MPKITVAHLHCAQARAHAIQNEVALDAHAVEVSSLQTALIASESKAAKVIAHARSLMKTTTA